jgi:hypothetical protein
MADPLSIAAGLTAVVGAGFTISKGLYDVVSTVKDAPQELFAIASEIHATAMMFDCIGELVDEHQGLYKDQLRHMLSDLRWRFKIIQDVIAKCIKPSRTPSIVRLRYLWMNKRISSLMVKLQALKHSMSITLSIAQMAERNQ